MNNNTGKLRVCPRLEGTVEERMNMYDALPYELRKALGEALMLYHPAWVRDRLKEGATVSYIKECIRYTDKLEHNAAVVEGVVIYHPEYKFTVGKVK